MLALPAVATATSPTRIAPSGSYDQYTLAVDIEPDDSAIFGWTSLEGGPHAEVATRAGSGRFGSPTRLGAGRILTVAEGPGRVGATAVWRDGGALRTARQDAAGRWQSQALPIPPGGSSIRVAGLDIDRTGTATVAIESRDARRWIVRAGRRGSDGRWSTDARDLVVDDAIAAQAGVDGTGGVTAAWVTLDEGRQSVRVSSRATAGTWSAPRIVFTGAAEASLAEPRVVTGSRGDVAVVISQTTATGVVGGGRVALRSAGSTTWVMSRPTAAGSVAISSRGAVWAGWLEGTGRRRIVVASRLDADGKWTRKEQVRGPASAPIVGGPGVAVNGDGQPFLWWVVDAATGPDSWFSSSRRQAGGWQAPQLLGRTNGSIEVAAGTNAALAIWVQDAGDAVAVTALTP